MEGNELGFLKYGDLFEFDGAVYKAGHVCGNGYVLCTNVKTKKVKKIHMDSPVKKVKGAAMSIRVNDFKWEKGKNDLEYIELLEKKHEVMLFKFRECAKTAKEQYNKGYQQGRSDAIEEYKNKIKENCYVFGNCDFEDLDFISNEMREQKNER